MSTHGTIVLPPAQTLRRADQFSCGSLNAGGIEPAERDQLVQMFDRGLAKLC